MSDRFWSDPRVLDAGNARRLPTPDSGPVDLAESHLSELRLINPTTREVTSALFAGTVTIRVDGQEVILYEGVTTVVASSAGYELVRRDAGERPELADPAEVAIDATDLAGDLNAAAAHLGVNVADLVKMRRKLGVGTSHRRPSLLARLLRRG